MPEFLLEVYATSTGSAESSLARLRESLAGSEDAHVVRALFLPDDETGLLFIEAPSLATASELVRSAGLPVDRITASGPIEATTD